MNNAIAILGGGLQKNKNGVWRTTNFTEGDNFGSLGDYLRVIAGNYLYKNDTRRLIIALGGKGQYKDNPDTPPISKIIRNELMELGIPVKNIILEKNSNNTYQQLIELQKIILNKNLTSIIIVSNKYHLPRVKTIIEYAGELKKLKIMMDNSKIKLESAEKIVIKYDAEKFNDIIKSAYAGEAMKLRISLEKKGIRQLKNGSYKLK